MKLNIGITEALCGFKLPIQHLANRELLIVNNSGKVVEPGLYLQGYSGILTCSSEFQASSINFSFVHQRPMLSDNRNHSTDLLTKSINWFLYEGKTGY